jgi:opacity protein-like surface antigen
VVLVMAAVLAARGAAADGVEVSLVGGKVFPFYEQSFEYDPGRLDSPIPGATIEQRGVFRLDASGALALGGGLSYFPTPHFGVELRLDTADVSVPITGAVYRVRADLPAPLPDLSTDVDLGQGEVDLERLRPVSLGLRLRSSGRTRAGLSAGVSYLPGFRFVAVQGVGLGVPALRGGRFDVDLARVSLQAEARPEDEGEGRFGVQAGATLERAVSARVALVAEFRYFRFQRQTLRWGPPRTDTPLPALEQEIVRQVQSRLEPVTFNPTFFHAAGGLAVSF